MSLKCISSGHFYRYSSLFRPNFAQRARSLGASSTRWNTQHTCAGPTECARPHVHPPPAQHPTHSAAAHTTTYSSVAAVINSYSLSAQLGVALRHQLTPRRHGPNQSQVHERAISTGYLNEICRGLWAAGFGCVIPTTLGAAPNCARVPRILGSSDILGKPFF